MNAERNHDWNHHDDLSALQSHGGIAQLTRGSSKLSNAVVSDPICQNGVIRFSVTSPRRYT